nr:DUF5640 domain-containing protein [Jutongia hominis]
MICKGCSGRTDALAGKWDFDGTTAYEFDGKGSGAMLLILADYDFTYEIKDNQLSRRMPICSSYRKSSND